MAVVPPELYLSEEGGSMTMLVGETVNYHVQVELMNQLLNRLQFYGTEDFSYQDMVFVSNLLRRAGVHRVDAFLEKLRVYREESKMVHELSRRYEKSSRLLHEAVKETEKQLWKQTERMGEPWEKRQNTEPLYLQEKISRNIQSVRNTNILQKYTGLAAVLNPAGYMREETSVSQLLRDAELVRLREIRKHIFGQESGLIYTDVRYREDWTKEPEAVTTKKVEESLAAEVLLQISQNIWYRSQNRYQNTQVWQDYRFAVYQSSENFWERIRTDFRWQELKERQSFRTRQVNQSLRKEATLVLRLEELERETERGAAIESEKQETILALLKLHNMQSQITEGLQRIKPERSYGEEKEAVETVHADTVLYELQKEAVWLDRMSEELEHRREQKAELPAGRTDIRITKETAEETALPRIWEQNIISAQERKERTEYEAGGERPQTAGMLFRQETVWQDNTEETEQPETKAGPSAEESRQELAEWRSYLEQINEQNLQMKALAEQYREEQQQGQERIVPDRKEIQKNALYYLEHPEAALQELPDRTFLQADAPSRFEKALLEAAPQKYEEYIRILERHKSGEGSAERENVAAQAELLLKEAVEEAFLESAEQQEERAEYPVPFQTKMDTGNTETLRKPRLGEAEKNSELVYMSEETLHSAIYHDTKEYAERMLNQMKLENSRMEKQMLFQTQDSRLLLSETEEEDRILKRQEVHLELEQIRLHEEQKRRIAPTETALIHKKEEQTAEELLEQVRQMKQSRSRSSTETEYQRQETHIERAKEQFSSQLTTQVTQQNEQQMQELFRSNLYTHINQITDQVYQKLEKRLASERRRRGY